LRAIIPFVLLVAGAASIAAGVKFHAVEVLAQIEQKSPAAPDSAGGPRPFWMQRGPGPDERPTYIATWLSQTEPRLIKEVTVGGVTLTEDGTIRRTYSGDMPSLCPT
jgi:hypothetical protein